MIYDCKIHINLQAFYKIHNRLIKALWCWQDKELFKQINQRKAYKKLEAKSFT